MGRTNLDAKYLEAFHAAVAQQEQIYAEFERLKNRRTLIESAARALEPLVYPDEYRTQEAEQAAPVVQVPSAVTQAPSTVIEFSRPAPSAEIWNSTTVEVPVPAPVTAPQAAPEARPVPAVTQVYVRGDGEPEEEIQRRINIAIGRTAAD